MQSDIDPYTNLTDAEKERKDHTATRDYVDSLMGTSSGGSAGLPVHVMPAQAAAQGGSAELPVMLSSGGGSSSRSR